MVNTAPCSVPYNSHGEPHAAGFVIPVVGPHDAISTLVDELLTAHARDAKAGNLNARNSLFMALQPKLLQLTRQIRPWMLSSTWERSDLEQEAFIVFVQLIATWPGNDSFGGYVLSHFGWRLRTVVKRARDAERLPTTRSESVALVEDSSWASEEVRVLLAELAATFPPLEQEILLGHVRDGEGFGALAYRLDVSRRTIYRHWMRILIELRKSLDLQVDLSARRYSRGEHRRQPRRGFVR